ncbi:hypothetical protein GGI35DRAFT_285807 [Trichoderma velutinum]
MLLTSRRGNSPDLGRSSLAAFSFLQRTRQLSHVGCCFYRQNGLQHMLCQRYVIAHFLCFCIRFLLLSVLLWDRGSWEEMASNPPIVGGHAPYSLPRQKGVCVVPSSFDVRMFVPTVNFTCVPYAKELKRGGKVRRSDRRAPKIVEVHHKLVHCIS